MQLVRRVVNWFAESALGRFFGMVGSLQVLGGFVGLIAGVFVTILSPLLDAPLHLQLLAVVGFVGTGAASASLIAKRYAPRLVGTSELSEARQLIAKLETEQDVKVWQASEDQAEIDRFHNIINTLITWLYRRQNWHGLSHDAQYSEPAPWDIWAKKKYADLTISDLKYDPPDTVGSEPGFNPPAPTPMSSASVVFPSSTPAGWDGTISQQPSRWLPDPSDLSTLALTTEDLDRALDFAEEYARIQLAPDAVAEFERIAVDMGQTKQYTGYVIQIDFRCWSDKAARGQIVSVGEPPDGAGGQYEINEKWTDSRPKAPWREDDSWLRLMHDSWYRIRSSLRGFAVLTFVPSESDRHWSVCYIATVPYNDADSGQCFRHFDGALKSETGRVERFHWF